MILLRQIYKILLTTGLIFFISTATVFSFGAGESWAATSFMQSIDPLYTQIASMDQAKAMTKTVGDKAQEVIGNMTSDPKSQMAGKAAKLEAKTRKGINNSIENPSYQPGGKTQQAESQDRENREGIKSEVREAFK